MSKETTKTILYRRHAVNNEQKSLYSALKLPVRTFRCLFRGKGVKGKIHARDCCQSAPGYIQLPWSTFSSVSFFPPENMPELGASSCEFYVLSLQNCEPRKKTELWFWAASWCSQMMFQTAKNIFCSLPLFVAPLRNAKWTAPITFMAFLNII